MSDVRAFWNALYDKRLFLNNYAFVISEPIPLLYEHSLALAAVQQVGVGPDSPIFFNRHLKFASTSTNGLQK